MLHIYPTPTVGQELFHAATGTAHRAFDAITTRAGVNRTSLQIKAGAVLVCAAGLTNYAVTEAGNGNTGHAIIGAAGVVGLLGLSALMFKLAGLRGQQQSSRV